MIEISKININAQIEKLRSYIETCNFAGYDPYDALNSPCLRLLAGKSKWSRIAFIQALKRLPVNVRPILGIHKGHNAKGLGLILWGYSKLYNVEKNSKYLAKIHYLLSLLNELKSQGYAGNCWGYNFDWQNRVFFLPKYTPTVVNSSFIGHALIDTYEYTKIRNALDMAISIKDFILNDLKRCKENGTFCFSYSPMDSSKVHNANLLGASLLIRLYGLTGIQELKDTAIASLQYSLKYQCQDGSWYYGQSDVQHWIDSFHTGFNLQSILYFLKEGFEEYRVAFEKGIKFYADSFFLKDGTPKYYHDSIYPIDIHSSSQAIVLLSALLPKYRSLLNSVTRWMLLNLCDPKGYFYFQKTKYYLNKISYMRWSQSWAFHGLTSFLLGSEWGQGLISDSERCLSNIVI